MRISGGFRCASGRFIALQGVSEVFRWGSGGFTGLLGVFKEGKFFGDVPRRSDAFQGISERFSWALKALQGEQ